jgi:RNA polymerase sigma factor (sigma-70 family)
MNEDTVLLEGLRNKADNAILEVYKKFYPPVEKYVLMNNGRELDAEDVFQNTVMILLSYVAKEDFILTSSIKTLVYAIARNIWLKQLRQRSRAETLYELETHQQDFISNWEDVERSERRHNSLPQVLNRISAHCSALLKDLFLTGKVPEHYKNDHSMRNQKYKCLEQARKTILKIQFESGDII